MTALGTLRDFCVGIGMVGPQELPAVLAFERSGQVVIEYGGRGLLVSLSRHVLPHRQGVAAAALRAVNPARGLPFAVHAAFRDQETLVLFSSLEEERLDVPTLDGLISMLARLADEAEAGA